MLAKVGKLGEIGRKVGGGGEVGNRFSQGIPKSWAKIPRIFQIYGLGKARFGEFWELLREFGGGIESDPKKTLKFQEKPQKVGKDPKNSKKSPQYSGKKPKNPRKSLKNLGRKPEIPGQTPKSGGGKHPKYSKKNLGKKILKFQKNPQNQKKNPKIAGKAPKRQEKKTAQGVRGEFIPKIAEEAAGNGSKGSEPPPNSQKFQLQRDSTGLASLFGEFPSLFWDFSSLFKSGFTGQVALEGAWKRGNSREKNPAGFGVLMGKLPGKICRKFHENPPWVWGFDGKNTPEISMKIVLWIWRFYGKNVLRIQ